MPESLNVLIARLDDVLACLRDEVAVRREAIDAVAPEHVRGATNLVHYKALRHHDLRGLQNDLMDLGATSLATAEANVYAKVLAARNEGAVGAIGTCGPDGDALIYVAEKDQSYCLDYILGVRLSLARREAA